MVITVKAIVWLRPIPNDTGKRIVAVALVRSATSPLSKAIASDELSGRCSGRSGLAEALLLDAYTGHAVVVAASLCER